MRSSFLLLLLMALLTGVSVRAQRFSYVYIQGDKQTPFYVKLNGDMMPRYGKNYCILPQLEAGTIKLDILFQQNAYPAQHFTIRVPENGSRAFMITRRDQAFSLYDLQQRFYLQAGNTEADDHLPEATAAPATIAQAEEPATEPEEAAQPAPEPVAKQKAPKKEKVHREKTPRPDKTARTAEKPADAPEDNGQPRFLDNVTLNNTHAQEQGAATEAPAATDTGLTQTRPLATTFRNSDCPQPLPDADFERIYKNMMEKDVDEDRVSYLNGQLDKCYQTWQARTLGSMLNEDAARFTFLKNIYPHITDQQAFPLLDDMLRSEVWKAQFLQLTHR